MSSCNYSSVSASLAPCPGRAWPGGLHEPTGICFKVGVACLLSCAEFSPVRLRASGDCQVDSTLAWLPACIYFLRSLCKPSHQASPQVAVKLELSLNRHKTDRQIGSEEGDQGRKDLGDEGPRVGKQHAHGGQRHDPYLFPPCSIHGVNLGVPHLMSHSVAASGQ